MGCRPIRGLLTLAVCSALLAGVGTAPASAAFGVSSFAVSFEDSLESTAVQAASHADVSIDLTFNAIEAGGILLSDGQVRDLELKLPTGLFGDPRAASTCSMAQLVETAVCSPAAQVGVVRFENRPDTPSEAPVYNMEAPPEQAAVLAADVNSVPLKIVLSAPADGGYGLVAKMSNINQGVAPNGTRLVLWGVPADPVHDIQRYRACLQELCTGYPAGIEPRPFLTMPTRCEPLMTALRVDSWQDPGVWLHARDDSAAPVGCEALEFSPILKARPTTNVADSPTGLDFDLEIPQSNDPEGLGTAHLRGVQLEFPEGLALNPAGANGLGACTPSQIGIGIQAAARCPDDAMIGRAEADVPAFPEPLKGAVFIAAPGDNPFGSLLAIYLLLEGRGLAVKLAGKVTADPDTGRLSLSFDDNPELPFSSLRLRFFGGAFAPFRTPLTCGAYSTNSTLASWAAPELPPLLRSDHYAIDRAPGGLPCPSREAGQPSKPDFEAGSTASIAGASKPFVVNLRRQDGTQRFSSVAMALPPGLVAKLAGVPVCSDGALAAAAAKSGAGEAADPSCPAGTAIGTVNAGLGAGPRPYAISGKAYLAGPYKGAPISLAIVVPGLAGPFDLGTIVVRVALRVDPRTAQVTAASDSIPSILKGIPFDLRSVSIQLDKPGFTRNPTSCDQFQVGGSLRSTSGSSTPLRNRFQLAECGRLAFHPRLAVRAIGPTRRSAHPRVRATLSMPTGGANLAQMALTLPKTALLAASHIRAVCTRDQFEAGACPAGSVYGHAVAISPLLDQPLRGPVYLRANSGRLLPDFVASLDGRVRLDVVGRVDSPRGRVRASFATPDVPLRRFSFTLDGGDRGLIVNTGGVCGASPPRAQAAFVAQNGKSAAAAPAVRADCRMKRASSG